MAMSYIGKTISLISQSDVRYRGILAGIDHQQRTIQLSNVFSLGTEARRTGEQFIPPNPEPYQYIIFRAQEVKDLSVDEQHPTRNVHEDPAVMNASQAPPQPYGQQAYPMQPQAPMAPAQPQHQPAPPAPSGNQPAPPQRRGTGGGVQTATASLETVERAIGDLRDGRAGTGGGGRRGGRSGGGQGAAAEPLRVPTSDFDFAGNNARFDKAGLRSPNSPAVASPDAGANGEANGTHEAEDASYNPSKSFFDNLTPARGGPGGGERGRGGRGGRGRSRRDEERDKNVATFGEPGGVGLMGPGAYVGGWGGFGRRGGRRGGSGRGGGEGGQRGQSRT